jgi:hypothetical protein
MHIRRLTHAVGILFPGIVEPVVALAVGWAGLWPAETWQLPVGRWGVVRGSDEVSTAIAALCSLLLFGAKNAE